MRDKYSFDPNAAAPASHHQIRDEIAGLFGTNKAKRTRNSDLILQDLERELGQLNGASAHPALNKYERGYLSGGGNWNAMRSTIKFRYSTIQAGGRQSRVRYVDVGNGVTTVHAFAGAGDAAVEAVVGTVYLDGARFEPLLHGPPNIFQRRTRPGRHYILLANGSYLRRFVTRGLNGYDGMNLTANNPLSAPHQGAAILQGEDAANRRNAHPKAVGAAITQDEELLSHTRGWKKRFVSTGVSQRAAYSTRGTQFISSFGVATIDLAQVPLNTIFDLHSPTAVQAWGGKDANDILTNPGDGHPGADYAGEEFLALRDVIRTREAVIRGQIPVAAVLTNPSGLVVLGIGSQTKALHDAIEGVINGLTPAIVAQIVGQEHHNFRGLNGRKWHFVRFQNAATCTAARRELRAPDRALVQFNHYTQVVPGGM